MFMLCRSHSLHNFQKHFPTDSWSDVGNNLYGCLKQLYLLKLKNRNLKVLLSIGGWTYSQSGKLIFRASFLSLTKQMFSLGHFSFVTSASARATFVANAVQLVEDYGFDGMCVIFESYIATPKTHTISSDVDFEYPANDAQGQGFADLLTALRTGLTQLQSKKGDSVPYQITAAVPAGSVNYQWLKVSQMNAALSYWNLMVLNFVQYPSQFTDASCSGIRLCWFVAHICRQSGQPLRWCPNEYQHGCSRQVVYRKRCYCRENQPRYVYFPSQLGLIY